MLRKVLCFFGLQPLSDKPRKADTATLHAPPSLGRQANHPPLIPNQSQPHSFAYANVNQYLYGPRYMPAEGLMPGFNANHSSLPYSDIPFAPDAHPANILNHTPVVQEAHFGGHQSGATYPGADGPEPHQNASPRDPGTLHAHSNTPFPFSTQTPYPPSFPPYVVFPPPFHALPLVFPTGRLVFLGMMSVASVQDLAALSLIRVRPRKTLWARERLARSAM
ncbi:hypothetical protein BKA93DRAFT_133694 [Sparassis latifolia]